MSTDTATPESDVSDSASRRAKRRAAAGMSVGDQVFYTFESAALLCDISVDILKDAVRVGRLRGKRTGANGGGLYLFSRDQLQAWFEGLADA